MSPRCERESSGAGDGPGRVHVLVLDGGRRGAESRAEVHHAHDGSAVTAVAHYTANTGYTLTVKSTPPTRQVITSSTSDGGMTNYPVMIVAYGTSVNLVAPATDPTGYTFLEWTVTGSAQPLGQKSITFTMTAATTAVAVYQKNAP